MRHADTLALGVDDVIDNGVGLPKENRARES